MKERKKAGAFGAGRGYGAASDGSAVRRRCCISRRYQFWDALLCGELFPEELPKAVAWAHSHGVRVHVTVNTMPRNKEASRLPAYLEQLQEAGVDALIVADLGAFTMAGQPRAQM